MLGKLARLSPADWRGLGVAYIYLLWAGWRMFVRREKLDRWIAPAPRPAPKRPLTAAERKVELRRAGIVNLAANRPRVWARCLQRSLALCLWMERKGYQPEIKIGVIKEGGELTAHAWVEYLGEVLNEDPERLAAFTFLESAPRNLAPRAR